MVTVFETQNNNILHNIIIIMTRVMGPVIIIKYMGVL